MEHEIEFLKKIDIPYSLGRVEQSDLTIELPDSVSITLKPGETSLRYTELRAKKRTSVTASEIVEIEKAIAAYENDANERLHWEDLSSPIQKLCHEAEEELSEKAKTSISKLRWLSRASGPPVFLETPGKTPSLYWRKNSSTEFLIIPQPAVINIQAMWQEFQSIDKFYDYSKPPSLERYHDEPLAHELIREAASLADENPRSALIMAHTALECGVKEHIGKLNPESEWFLENLNSPPLNKLLISCLSEIHDSKFENGWKSALDKVGFSNRYINNLSVARNDLAHSGKNTKHPNIDRDLKKYIENITDILYLLDYLEGHDWAKRCLSGRFRKILGELKST